MQRQLKFSALLLVSVTSHMSGTLVYDQKVMKKIYTHTHTHSEETFSAVHVALSVFAWSVFSHTPHTHMYKVKSDWHIKAGKRLPMSVMLFDLSEWVATQGWQCL